MLLPEINQKMPIYKDCTIAEVMIVVGGTLLFLMVMLSFLTLVLFGHGWIGCILSLFFVTHLSRFLLGRVQKLKFGKPEGFYIQVLLKKISHYPLFSFLNLPYVQRTGKWSVRRDGKEVRL